MKKPRPPRLPYWLVVLFFRGEQREVILGDLEEGFADLLQRDGQPREASRWYRWHALASLAALISDRVSQFTARERKPSISTRTPAKNERGDSRVSKLRYEARIAVRSLLRQPAFSLVVVLTVALGIGANVAIFSLLNGILLKPLPFPDSEGLVSVSMSSGARPNARDYMSHPDIADLADQSPTLATLVGYDAFSVTLTGDGEPALIRAARLTGGLLETFLLTPELGRDIRPDECGPNAPRIAVISHTLWQDRFGMATDVVGRIIEINGRAYEVIGVAPEGFGFPARTQLWMPHRIGESCGRGCHNFLVVGRLAPAASVTTARAEAETIAGSLAEVYPESNKDKGFRVESLQDVVVGNVRKPLWILLAAVTAVLLIACANVANLLLVRASTRTGEVAMRVALGASRRRILAKVMTESSILALVGGAVGLAMAKSGVELVRLTSAGMVPRVGEVKVDAAVIAFTMGLVFLVTLLFGSIPAAYLLRAPLSTHLNAPSRGSKRGHSRRLLVGLEVALSVVLLFGAGLLLKSFGNLYAVDLGFETHGIVRTILSLPSLRYRTLEDVRTFYRTLEDRIAALPGVESVGSVYGAPLGDMHTTSVVLVEGRPEPQHGQETYAAIRAVSPNYIETLRIPLVRGRALEPADDVATVPVGVVNQAFVRENFPTEDPIGKKVRIKTDMGFGSPYWTIVGIVGDIRSHRLVQSPVPEIYIPHGRFGPRTMSVNVRSPLDVESLLPTIRAEVRALDPKLPLQNTETFVRVVGREVAPTRFSLLLLGGFAALALVLTAVGLYGVLAYLVSQRTKEIGIRIAMGADKGTILRMVLSNGLWPALAGIALGIAASFSAGRALEAILYEVTPLDPWILISVPAVLLVTTLLASLVPARRATLVDPVQTLRAE
jgi:predicted permease